MTKYQVVFSIGYKLTALDKEAAIRKAECIFAKEIDNLDCGLTEIFNVKAEEVT